MAYTPHSDNDVKEMLETIGVESIDALFDSIPANLRAKSFDLEEGLSEPEVYGRLQKMANKNRSNLIQFMGGGYYDHMIPAAVDALSGRSEFYTAYTPYQPEASQGTLQALYEYQSMICELTGMDATNASMYDGGSAMAEAALMAVRITKRNKIVLDGGIHPHYREIVKTYLAFHDIVVFEVPTLRDGIDKIATESFIDEEIAAYIFQNPNFYGTLQDFEAIIASARNAGALVVQSVYPVALGMLNDPGSLGVDIVCGDGQSLGNPLSFGGPYFGILATTEQHLRQLPGRIAGKSVDKNGKEGYVLTLQAREQHIRRHRATSNICSNQNLCALRAAIFMSLVGKQGLQEMAEVNYQKAEYLKNALMEVQGLSIWNANPTYNEFVLMLPSPTKEIINKMKEKGFAAGINMKEYIQGGDKMMLVSVTEKRSKEELDSYVAALSEVIS